MKKYISIFMAMAVVASSCDKKLDLLPQQSVAEEVALSSDANVKKVLNGAYDAMSSGNLYGGNVLLYSELLAANGEIRWEGTFNQPREVWLKAILTTNSFVRDTWLSAYNTINIANNVLTGINVVNTADQNRVKGEALFIRGAMYFELIRLFAKPYSAGSVSAAPGVPLILTPTRGINQSSYVARSTVEQVYTQILADLTEAEGLLPNTNTVYVAKPAASAMLSRVYLQMEKYPEARDAANRSITVATANGKSLASNYAAVFNNSSNSVEYLFATQVSALDGANNMHLYWSIPAYGGRDGDVSIQASHLALYSAGDDRLDLFYSGAGDTRSGKWQQQYKVLPVIRLAEMYLTRAEANFRAGTSVGESPVNDVNRTRNRAGLGSLGTVTLADILLERKLELAHEGHAVHDLKRLKLSADGFAYNADKMVFPIPQREVDAHAGVLVQNAGY
ncbi:MAG TPA: RagB/SusD family nutrient uptake outer membrane protein [Chitinophagaceae bacterium]|nr:RagB/SusD family nutrient uptake outer membrane protein [Chitinophagaceae bacterium]HQV84407.1 RagB/SusD family nutrient uptake outer membrane protein [Chitinophagaceae bacterium]HQX72215.1 RagB/SusD family nutrient uptake outer membrane protein [Chitinophagaceae bacterium]HQZ73917.1 RagB/SusD family nutrient uptake outer membrane protein [Chitinophagaceae bacterium]